ncbi:MAG: helix-turn-helix domain-containing protein [Patescibacteria group bacterium]|nr:helix-turn-helix domain-containing protein [Patescibacteria group bacterium]
MDMGRKTVNFSIEKIGTAYSVYKSCGWLVQGLYHKNGFIPSSKHFLKCPRAIGFPKIEYSNCKNFWKRVEKYQIDTLPNDKGILNFLIKNINLAQYERRIARHKDRLELYWRGIDKKFYKFLFELYPEFKTKTIILNVFSVPYGSLCGFSSVQYPAKEKLEGNVFLRIDMPEEQLIEGIFSALLSNSLLRHYSWSQKEAIIDFLVERFLKGYKKSQPYFKTTRILEKQEINKNLLRNSKRFIEKLSIPLDKPFKIQKQNISYFGKKLNQIYMPIEKEILQQFIDKDDNILSYDEIADIIWKDKSNEQFSLWAINKRIHRLRSKLMKEGMPKAGLMTVRGVGYYLG